MPEYDARVRKFMSEFGKISKMMELIPYNVCVKHLRVTVDENEEIDNRRKRYKERFLKEEDEESESEEDSSEEEEQISSNRHD